MIALDFNFNTLVNINVKENERVLSAGLGTRSSFLEEMISKQWLEMVGISHSVLDLAC